jgi:hypothetical protein
VAPPPPPLATPVTTHKSATVQHHQHHQHLASTAPGPCLSQIMHQGQSQEAANHALNDSSSYDEDMEDSKPAAAVDILAPHTAARHRSIADLLREANSDDDEDHYVRSNVAWNFALDENASAPWSAATALVTLGTTPMTTTTKTTAVPFSPPDQCSPILPSRSQEYTPAPVAEYPGTVEENRAGHDDDASVGSDQSVDIGTTLSRQSSEQSAHANQGRDASASTVLAVQPAAEPMLSSNDDAPGDETRATEPTLPSNSPTDANEFEPGTETMASDAPATASLTIDTNTNDANDNPESNDRSAAVLQLGNVVQVQSRTWPGVNKPGGVAKITKVHDESGCSPPLYDVQYVVDRRKEKRVDAIYLELHDEMNTALQLSPTAASDATVRHSRRPLSAKSTNSSGSSSSTTNNDIPPELLAQLVAEGFATDLAATTRALGHFKENTSRAHQTKGKKRKPQRAPFTASHNVPPEPRGVGAKRQKPAISDTAAASYTLPVVSSIASTWTDSIKCAKADAAYHLRIQAAMAKGTVHVTTSCLSGCQTEHLTALCRAIKGSQSKFKTVPTKTTDSAHGPFSHSVTNFCSSFGDFRFDSSQQDDAVSSPMWNPARRQLDHGAPLHESNEGEFNRDSHCVPRVGRRLSGRTAHRGTHGRNVCPHTLGQVHSFVVATDC